MLYADEKYNKIIETISTNGYSDKGQNVRTVYADGSTAYTKSIFGVQVDFEKGVIPILTTKKVFWKTALKEMLLFWQSQTVKENDFKEHGVKVWDEWFKDGNLGRSYAYQFESHRHHDKDIVKIKPITKEHHGELKQIENIYKTEKPNTNNSDEIIGKELFSNFGLKYIVLDTYKSDTHYKKNKSAKIQFINSGYIDIVTLQCAMQGRVDDLFRRSLCGVGYLGDYKSVKNFKKEEIKILHKKWQHMIERCYNNNTESYKYYGMNGVFVSENWHSFENFLRDIRYLPQFFLARENNFENWSIDKDYFQSNCYSKDTCVWLKISDNLLYRSIVKPFYSIDSKSNKILHLSISECVKELQLLGRESDISGCLRNTNNRKSVNNYEFKYIEDDKFVYRYELSRNQVVELLKNIKNNPQSRRLGTSFWNWADVDKKQLQECAWATNLNIRDDELDLLLIQRSGDIGLGVPFNWIQYYFLQNMIAHTSNLKVGRFIHQISNLHYYDRHEESLLKQIEKQMFEQPVLWINPDVKDFFDFTQDDIKLLNYESGEYIPMEVAI